MKTKKEIKALINQIRARRALSCKSCGYSVCFSSRGREEVICQWKWCRKRRSIWEETIFYKTRVKKITILQILDLWMNKMSLSAIKYVLNLKNRKIIWRVLKRVAAFLVPNYRKAEFTLGGKDIIVEVDESKFGRRKYNRGHRVNGVWVLGMVEKTPERKIKLIAVDDRSKATLEEYLKNNVDTGSIIYTDGWRGYSGLGVIFSCHQTVNHSLNFKDPETGVHTNTIEGNWAGIKPSIAFRLRTKEKIDLYLTRYMLLRNEECHPLEAIFKYLL